MGTAGSRPPAHPRRHNRRVGPWLSLLLVTAVASCWGSWSGEAHGSIEIGVNASNATLQVDAGGNAAVSWDEAGTRRSVVIDRDGSVHFDATFPGPDVSRPSAAVNLPWEVAERQAPDGTLYALQAWRRLETGPLELRFARWTGAPTTLTLTTVCCKWGSIDIEGAASFHGRPIFGYSATPQGAPLDPFGRNVYLDTYRAGQWQRMMGILTHRPTGTFSLWIRSNWLGSGYRGTIPGPNWGWTLAPDASAQTNAT